MDESEQVSELIGDIYDAALDRSLWPSVLETTCRFVNGQTAGLVAQRPAQGKAHFYFEWGTQPPFLESYQKTYALINPVNILAIAYSKIGVVTAASDLIPLDELRSCRLYKEWLAPQGIVDVAFVVFEKSAASYAALAVQRNERHGLVDKEAKHRLSLLAQHFRRAVAIGQIIDLHKFEAAALADTFDGLAAAVFLVDADGRLVHVNTAGHAALDKDDVIQVVSGRFTTADAQANVSLREIFLNAENGDAAVSTKGIDVPIGAHNGDRHVAHVLPLTSGARRKAGSTYNAVAAVFIRKAELKSLHPLETIATLFKLTSAEMRVLMMVVQLGGAREVAPVLGISQPTVKTHLKHIFEKTGTGRQADLVKLVAGYMSPLGTAHR